MNRPWTAELVEERYVAAFRELHAGAVLNEAGGLLRSCLDGKPLGSLDLIVLVGTILPADDDRRKALDLWAKTKAGIAGIQGFPSISEWCRARGWSHQTFDNRRRAGAKHVAEAVNAFRAMAGLREDAASRAA